MAGVFLLPILVLLPLGAYYILSQRRTVSDRFVLIGFFVAPIGAALLGEVKASRVLVMVPLAALVAARGFEALVSARSMLGKGVAVVLAAALVVQFQWFYGDYVGEYRERSSPWFEGNRDAAFASLVGRADANRAPALYVSNDIVLVNYSWQFFVLKHQRTDLKDRVTFFGSEFDFATAPKGSLFLAAADVDHPDLLNRAPDLTRVAVIENADRHPAFAVYEK